VEHWQKRVGNGAKTATLADGTYVLTLPCGLLIQLENCYYVPARILFLFLVWTNLVFQEVH
jgi:hypothetical protein